MTIPENRRQNLSIIVKTTQRCPLLCDYCYVEDSLKDAQSNAVMDMDLKTLENMIIKASFTHTKISYIWHGGEPLAMPLSFYEYAVSLQKRFPKTNVNNGFQTGGTLVTDEVLSFCENNNFDLGFSLDGSAEVNALSRHYSCGKNNYDETFEAINKARARKVGGGVIVILNKKTIAHIDEIYSWIKDNDLSVKINPLIESGNAKNNWKDIGIGPKEYGQAMVRLFDKWFNDPEAPSIDPFSELIGNIITNMPWGCNYSTSCQNSFISINPQGDIYPCGRFDGVKDMKLGNINNDDLLEVLYSKKRIDMKLRIQNISECQPCEYKQICNSGCMHNSYIKDGSIYSKDYYCPSYKLLFSHIKDAVAKEFSKAEVKNV